MIDHIISSVYALIDGLGYHHPLHPTQVHVPIGLIVGAFFLGGIGKIRQNDRFSRAAWYCLVMALIFTIPTVLTGWMDWHHFLAGAIIAPIKMKLLLAGLLLVVLISGSIMGRGNGGTAKGLMRLYTVGLIIVMGLGYFGGELVYRKQTAATPETYQAGMELYVANCNGCHAGGGNIIKPNLPVKHSAKVTDYDTFLSWIRAPVPPMPAYPSAALSDEEVKEIYGYIINSLNKS